jgi:hypothetical protein
VEKAGFVTAAAAGIATIFALELFSQVDAEIPFVYFQF